MQASDLGSPQPARDAFPEARVAVAVEAADRRLREMLQGASLEVSSRRAIVAETLGKHARAGTDIFVGIVPGENHHQVLETAAAVRRAGFNPVPHIAARNLLSFTQLNDYLARAAGEAGVTKALVIAGDAERPCGPFPSSVDLLATGLFQKHGIRSVGVAGYPEGNPKIARHALDQALKRKLEIAAQGGLEPWIATQFCFETGPIIRWLTALRERRVDVPVRIGLAGPASVATLLKFALRCGIGNSLHTLKARPNSVTRLLGETEPDQLVRELAAAVAQMPALSPVGLHFYAFGGVPKTAQWIERMLAASSAED